MMRPTHEQDGDRRPVQQLLGTLRFSRPRHHRGLTVVALRSREARREAAYFTLEQALGLGHLTVSERAGGACVDRVCVTNRGERPVLLLDGEELVGAMQNRIVAVSVLVAAGASLEVPVACVEQGRWRAKGSCFEAGGSVLGPGVRGRKTAGVVRSLEGDGVPEVDQGALWDDVGGTLRSLGVESATSALADARRAHGDAIEGYVGAFAAEAESIGAVFLIGERVAGLELVDSTAAWGSIFPKVLRGYALDALGSAAASARAGGRRGAAKAFLERVCRGPWKAQAAVGAGRLATLGLADVTGSAVMDESRVLHLVAFPRASRPSSGGGGGPADRGGRGCRLSILFLDDDPRRHEAFARQARGHRVDHVWYVDDALRLLREKRYDVAMLDNDLETEALQREGVEVARFIAGMAASRRPGAVLIHSWNLRRAREMEALLARVYRPGVSLVRAEFGSWRLRGVGAGESGPGAIGVVGASLVSAGAVDLRRWLEQEERLARTA